MFDLKDRVAIVTGGAQGVGGGISRMFAKAGAKVLIADLDLETAEDTANQISNSSGIVECVQTDVMFGESAISAKCLR